MFHKTTLPPSLPSCQLVSVPRAVEDPRGANETPADMRFSQGVERVRKTVECFCGKPKGRLRIPARLSCSAAGRTTSTTFPSRAANCTICCPRLMGWTSCSAQRKTSPGRVWMVRTNKTSAKKTFINKNKRSLITKTKMARSPLLLVCDASINRLATTRRETGQWKEGNKQTKQTER